MNALERSENNGLAGFDPPLNHGGRSDRSQPRVTPIAKGEAIAIYPDTATEEVMKSESWTAVIARPRRNAAGEVEEIALVKSTDGTGVSLRTYTNQRSKFHVTVKGIGKAVAKPGGTCTVRRVGDAFVFRIIDAIDIVPTRETSR
jgi:hypothetical protein